VAGLPPIYYIRHGETEWNRQGLIQGSIDTDLNALGRQQAEELAQALLAHKAELTSYKFFVSPQRRAQDTMKAIATAQGRDPASIITDIRLRELEFGVWEGKPLWELKNAATYPADLEGRFYWRPEGGESYEDGMARVASFS
jgi:probable phosphoglycerate mutase